MLRLRELSVPFDPSAHFARLFAQHDDGFLLESAEGPERLARYKIPRRLFILNDVPRSANGKVPKQLLRSLLVDRGLIPAQGDVPPISEAAAAHVS